MPCLSCQDASKYREGAPHVTACPQGEQAPSHRTRHHTACLGLLGSAQAGECRLRTIDVHMSGPCHVHLPIKQI